MNPLVSSLQDSVDELFRQMDAGVTTQERARLQLELLKQSFAHASGGGPVLRAAAQTLNARAPVNRLPAELLYLIFRRLDQTALYCTPTRVCSHLRETALADARLWTRVHVRCWHALDAIPTLLQRSGDAVVDMRLELNRMGIGLSTPPDIQRCAEALAAHIHRFGQLDVTAFSTIEFRNVLGLAIERSSPRLEIFSLHITSLSRAIISLDGSCMLRSLSTSVRPKPGDWMRSLEILKLDYTVPFKNLLKILSCTPSLKSLHLKRGTENDVMSPLPLDTGIRPHNLQELIVENATGHAMDLIDSNFPVSHLRKVAVMPVEDFIHGVPILFSGFGPVSALGFSNTSPRHGFTIALADIQGRRRLVTTSQELHPLTALLLLGNRLLSEVNCLTVFVSNFPDVSWTLQDVPLDRLHTFIFEVEVVKLNGIPSVEARRFLSDRTPHMHLETPALRDIVLVLARKPPRQVMARDKVATIDATIALEFIDNLATNAALLPRLRLVNVRISPESGATALDKLHAKVSAVFEESLDESESRPWMGVPEYAFCGWKTVSEGYQS